MTLPAALLLLAVLLPAGWPDDPPQGDRALMLDTSQSSKIIVETPPEGANGAERVAWKVYQQLTGRDFYSPPNYMFFRQAVREIGFIPAVPATIDRILRDSKIGTADIHAAPPFREGPEAYLGKPFYHRPATPRLPAATMAPEPVQEAPTAWISSDFDFARYLMESGYHSDARALLQQSVYHASDTLSLLRGMLACELKELPSAAEFLKEVSESSPLYPQALFYSAAVDAHLGDYDSHLEKLGSYSGPYAEVAGVQLAALALLRDDPEGFRSAAGSFSHASHILDAPEQELESIYRSRYETRPKSPWLAAAASAVVPGLGKIYAGRIGEGVESFLLTGVAGAITAEQWIKNGPRDWKTILSGCITAALYISNIYGSYMSVSIVNTNLHDAQDTAIMYNLHIPLRSIFR